MTGECTLQAAAGIPTESPGSVKPVIWKRYTGSEKKFTEKISRSMQKTLLLPTDGDEDSTDMGK